MITFKNIKNLILLLITALISLYNTDIEVIAAIPSKPEPQRLVNDYANLFSKNEIEKLEEKLRNYNDTTGTQIVIVVLKSLEGYAPNDMAQRIGQKWGVGQDKQNNGVIILIKPKLGNEKGNIAISTGYGMEATIQDITIRRIIENEMIPDFKNNNFYIGVDKAIDVIISLNSGIYTADKYQNNNETTGFLAIFIILTVVFLIIYLKVNTIKRRHNTVGKVVPWWILLSQFNEYDNKKGNKNFWDDFTNGSGSFGSGSGSSGGFGGFGGGSFGGGGASGSW